MKKKNSINHEDFEDILFVPKKQNQSSKITFVVVLLGLGLIAYIMILMNYGIALNSFFQFPLEQLSYTENTNVFCKNRDYTMGGSPTIDDWNYTAMMKTDFVGGVENNFILPAKKVVLGVKINGITNPSTEWWMGKVTIDKISSNDTTSFKKELNHHCSQGDISWSFKILSAEF